MKCLFQSIYQSLILLVQFRNMKILILLQKLVKQFLNFYLIETYFLLQLLVDLYLLAINLRSYHQQINLQNYLKILLLKPLHLDKYIYYDQLPWRKMVHQSLYNQLVMLLQVLILHHLFHTAAVQVLFQLKQVVLYQRYQFTQLHCLIKQLTYLLKQLHHLGNQIGHLLMQLPQSVDWLN